MDHSSWFCIFTVGILEGITRVDRLSFGCTVAQVRLQGRGRKVQIAGDWASLHHEMPVSSRLRVEKHCLNLGVRVG